MYIVRFCLLIDIELYILLYSVRYVLRVQTCGNWQAVRKDPGVITVWKTLTQNDSSVKWWHLASAMRSKEPGRVHIQRNVCGYVLTYVPTYVHVDMYLRPHLHTS
jgi:hypothetical protein